MRRTLPPTLAAYAAGRTIAPLWISPSGRAFYPIAGGSEDPPSDPPPKDPPADPKPSDPKPGDEGKTFTQADVDRIIEGRFKKYADYDTVKSELEKIREANATEAEKAAKAARDEGYKAALTEATPRLVLAEFRAAAGGRVTDALKEYLDDVDPMKFVDDKGEIDTERIAAKVAALSPEPAPNKPPLGGGARKTEKPDVKPGLDRLRNAYADSSK